ncbi:MAG TPA: class I adenylate-forming enzyme family protein [Kofleriaceae bacterium]|nr:class I adenylate-forming enzyme family protein [Kofleriaceae bacterium]
MRDAIDPTVAALLAWPEDRVVVQTRDGSWTAGELRGAAARVAASLRALGVTAGDRVGVEAAPSAEVVAVLLGARALGCLVLPLEPRRARVLARQFRLAVSVVDGPTGPNEVSPAQLLAHPTSARLRAVAAPLAWSICTSGTTGTPKGVVLGSAGITEMIANVQQVMDYRASDRVLSALPLHHVYGLSQLWVCLATGATLVLPPSPLLVGDLERWLDGITVWPAIPSTVRALVAARSCRRPRLITLSGQATPARDRQQLVTHFATTRFLQFYGSTEAFRVLWTTHDELVAEPEATGRPTPGMTAWLDANDELVVEGPNVALGYLDEPELTRAKFPRRGQFATGDLFRRRGELFCYRGRADGVFKSFGEKVIPEVIERALAAHPGVEACVVVPELDARSGELRPLARVVLRDATCSSAELVAFLRPQLPSILVPRIALVEALPTTSSGKQLRGRG